MAELKSKRLVERDSVAVYFARAAVARLDERQRPAVLAAAGIRAAELEVPEGRVPAPAFAALWLAVAQALDDEFFGLDRRRMKVGSFAVLCQAVLHASDVGAGLRRYLRGIQVCLDQVGGTLANAGGQATVTLTNAIVSPARRRFADEAFLIMLHGVMCWLAGQRIPLTRVDFAHAAPPHAAEYGVMFSQDVRFAAERTAIVFDAGWLAAPVVQTEATLKVFLRNAPQSVFLKYKNTDSWTARVRRRLRSSLAQPRLPVLDEIAAEFHVAPATLKRRLDTEGSSYQGIKDSLRRDTAIHLLCHGRQSVDEIARAVGFQDTSTFYRAFKKWCGTRPGEYRQSRAASGPAAGAAVRSR